MFGCFLRHETTKRVSTVPEMKPDHRTTPPAAWLDQPPGPPSDPARADGRDPATDDAVNRVTTPAQPQADAFGCFPSYEATKGVSTVPEMKPDHPTTAVNPVTTPAEPRADVNGCFPRHETTKRVSAVPGMKAGPPDDRGRPR